MIHRRILIEWNCYTMFKHYRTDVRHGIPTSVMWMIPRDFEQAFELAEWLEPELAAIREPPTDVDHGNGEMQHWPGTEAEFHIVDFHGIEWYLTEAESAPMIEQAAKDFRAMFDREMKKRDKTEGESDP